MDSPDSSRSDVSVEGLIDRFRHGRPLHARSPRRASPKRRPTLDRIIAQDIQELDAIIHHSRSTSPRRRPVRAVSPRPASPAPPQAPLLRRKISVEDDIASMLLQQHPWSAPREHEAKPPAPPATPEINVSASTADVIRNTGIAIDRDMAQALSSFQRWEESRADAVGPSPEEKQEAALPVSALAIATDLDAAFELLNKKANEYPKPAPAPAPAPPSVEALQAKSIVQGNAISTPKELSDALERLDKASEAAAATSPQLDHVVRHQAITDDRELHEILIRLNTLTNAPAPLFPADFPHTTRPPADDIDTLMSQLQRIKQAAQQRTQAIDQAFAWGPDVPVPERPLSPPASPQHLSDDEDGSTSDADSVCFASLSLHSRAIVEDLSVAMYTLRHRLDLDAKEAQERTETEAREQDARAKAKAAADAAKAKAEQDRLDLLAAKANNRWFQLPLTLGPDSEPVSLWVDPQRHPRLPAVPAIVDDAKSVLLRFDALVPPHCDNQRDHDESWSPQQYHRPAPYQRTVYDAYSRLDDRRPTTAA
ncbi:hypothetical protein ACHHYP_07656 [Achlya hypogyna]|uniref:Uncharacterized protein n=1 Tax=Achlya hypogyna TaxID=1202772 RepID=A0A1V9YQP1_ACHHY|nr:hypothetical protein ACHHYP_07656 [Achlya hypogyna]